jgi:hypothetical protein
MRGIMKRTILILLSSLPAFGCVSLDIPNHVMESTGAKKGELPMLANPMFMKTHQMFRTKLAQFRNSNVVPGDSKNFVKCLMDEENVQEIVGYKGLLDSELKNRKNASKNNGSLASQVTNDAQTTLGNQFTTEYKWLGGSVQATAEDCEKLATNIEAPGIKFSFNFKYTSISNSKINVGGKIHESNTSSTLTSQTFTENGANFSLFINAIAIKYSANHGSSKVDGVDSPTFTLRYSEKDSSDAILYMEMGITRDLFDTKVIKDLNDGRTRTTSYKGAALSSIARFVNNKPHGLWEDFGKGSWVIPRKCYSHGEIVTTTECDAF